MSIGPRHVIAFVFWGMSAVMMQPVGASLLVAVVNAVLLAVLVYLPTRKDSRHA